MLVHRKVLQRLERSQSCFSTTTLNVCRVSVLPTMDSMSLQGEGTSVELSGSRMCKTEKNRHLSELVVSIETGAERAE